MTTLASAAHEATGVPSAAVVPGRDPVTGRRQVKPLVRRAGRADQAADHRAAARHDRAGHGAGCRAAGRRCGWSSLTLVGGTLAAGSANTINCYVDRDIDAGDEAHLAPTAGPGQGAGQPGRGAALRDRARRRRDAACSASPSTGRRRCWPTPRSPFYVFVYTLGLKRRTPNNIVIGGAAGCFPVLIGWSAVTGNVGWPAVVLFAVDLLLDPAALLGAGDEVQGRLRRRRRADAAGGRRRSASVTRQIVCYSYAMVATSLLLVPIGDAGWLYLGAAAGRSA